jgi:hypothetical protein
MDTYCWEDHWVAQGWENDRAQSCGVDDGYAMDSHHWVRRKHGEMERQKKLMGSERASTQMGKWGVWLHEACEGEISSLMA